MKEHPILMSGAMIRAILDGRKTQTRRVVKMGSLAPSDQAFDCLLQGDAVFIGHHSRIARVIPCPYGQPGDRLWVRETWRECGSIQMCDDSIPREGLLASPDRCRYKADGEWDGPWRPPIFMPRWASRITLEVVSVRVERLNDISLADVEAEGTPYSLDPSMRPVGSRTEQYAALWDSINGKGSWASNPFVWAIEFKVMNEFRARPKSSVSHKNG